MVKDTLFRKKQFINCSGNLLDLSEPRIMGILNVTPDSFYDGGKYLEKNTIIEQARKILAEGADIIDVGGYSSRPGATEISTGEELSRLSFALEFIREEFPEALISVDTYRSKVAYEVVTRFKVNIINDISGGELDKDMQETIVSLQIPYIIMHMQGDPETMQKRPRYKDPVPEIMSFLGIRAEELMKLGHNDIIIDPGFGFGKTVEQNYHLLSNLDAFNTLGLPLLAGLSRKSMIYKFLDIDPAAALTGTIVLNTIALMKGANILRVHDVQEARQTINLFLKTLKEKENASKTNS